MVQEAGLAENGRPAAEPSERGVTPLTEEALAELALEEELASASEDEAAGPQVCRAPDSSAARVRQCACGNNCCRGYGCGGNATAVARWLCRCGRRRRRRRRRPAEGEERLRGAWRRHPPAVLTICCVFPQLLPCAGGGGDLLNVALCLGQRRHQRRQAHLARVRRCRQHHPRQCRLLGGPAPLRRHPAARGPAGADEWAWRRQGCAPAAQIPNSAACFSHVLEDAAKETPAE